MLQESWLENQLMRFSRAVACVDIFFARKPNRLRPVENFLRCCRGILHYLGSRTMGQAIMDR